jgi:DNA-binding protein YbaB
VSDRIGRVRRLDTDAARERAVDTLSGLQDQMAEITAVQKKQAALRVDGAAAGDTVEVTVDARGRLVRAVIDKSFLDDHDFEELGGCIVEAAQAAGGEAEQRVAEMMAPINERHRSFPSFSEIFAGLPEVRDLMPPGLDVFGAAPPPGQEGSSVSAGDGVDDGDSGADFPTVRR